MARGDDVRDALKAYLSLGGGLTEITRQRAVATARALVAQGEATAEQVSGIAEDLVVQSRANREAVIALVAFEVERAVGLVGLASADEVGELAARLRVLETEVRQLRTHSADASATPPAPEAAKASAKAAKVPAKAAKAPAKAAGSPVKTAKAPAKAAKAPAKAAKAARAADREAGSG